MNHDKPLFELLFLGTGTSTGVPMIGCDCPVCTSPDPRNRRLRSSLYLRLGDIALLLDTATDLREQAITHNIRQVDAVLFTHAHADHVFGLDDLRRFNTLQQNQVIPAYAVPETAAEIRRVFSYLFQSCQHGLYRARVDLREVGAPFRVAALGCEPELDAPLVTPVDVVHGDGRTIGYRIDFGGRSLGYAPDCVTLPEEAAAAFRGVDVMIIDSLRYRPHQTHMHVEASLEAIGRIAPARAFLTHLCHEIDHATLAAALPEHVQPAYDGLRLRL